VAAAIGGRTFVNTASFGAYAEVVKIPAYRDDKRGIRPRSADVRARTRVGVRGQAQSPVMGARSAVVQGWEALRKSGHGYGSRHAFCVCHAYGRPRARGNPAHQVHARPGLAGLPGGCGTGIRELSAATRRLGCSARLGAGCTVTAARPIEATSKALWHEGSGRAGTGARPGMPAGMAGAGRRPGRGLLPGRPGLHGAAAGRL